MALWISIAIVTLLATALVVWPLVSTRRMSPGDDHGDEQRRVAIFRDRKHEIEREREAGRLTADEAAQAQSDLLQQLAGDLPEGAPQRAGTTRPSRSASRIAALAVAVLIPLVAVGVYRHVGSPHLATPEARDAAGRTDAAQVDEMIAQIESRTREHPEDGEAWAMLGQARKIQGRHAEAVSAFEKAVERLPDNAALLTDFAESAALLAGGNFEGRPLGLLERALKVDPSEPRAVALMGAVQYRMGNMARARVYLKQLEAFLAPGSEEAQQIASILARIDADLAGRGDAGGAAAQDAPRRPAEQAAQPAPGAPTRPTEASVAGTVRIDPSLTERAFSGGTLYVIARQSGGPPVPIAALRLPGAAFPASFRLDDSNAMDPSRRLSSASSMEIEARLSRSGDAMRKPGDLYGRVLDVRPGERDLEIVIDKVVAP